VKPSALSPLSLIALLFLSSTSAIGGSSRPASAKPSDAAVMEQKLRHLEDNARLAHPDQAPATFTEQEANSYLASDKVKLPAGVQSVKLEGAPGVITGEAQVDFDRIREGTHSSNPLLSIFSGVHDVVVIAHAHGAGGQGYVHVDAVSLDGVEIPEFVLELFVDKFLQPKYPQIGLDSQFALPDRIDIATVGLHKLIVTQK
jgi:hypothetical protein